MEDNVKISPAEASRETENFFTERFGVFLTEKPMNRWKLSRLYYDYSYFKSNVCRMLDTLDYACDSDSVADFIISQYENRITKKDSKSFDNPLPSQTPPFGTSDDWIAFMDGLMNLHIGIPNKYLESYQKLKELKMEYLEIVEAQMNEMRKFSARLNIIAGRLNKDGFLSPTQIDLCVDLMPLFKNKVVTDGSLSVTDEEIISAFANLKRKVAV